MKIAPRSRPRLLRQHRRGENCDCRTHRVVQGGLDTPVILEFELGSFPAHRGHGPLSTGGATAPGVRQGADGDHLPFTSMAPTDDSS
eukprot:scaffold2773_cov410-Prasinococcus_capsulatus_cf.AAC.15